MAKDIKYNVEARNLLKEGVDALATVVGFAKIGSVLTVGFICSLFNFAGADAFDSAPYCFANSLAVSLKKLPCSCFC